VPRVLHVAQPTDGGVGRYVADIIPRQLAAGWDVHLACPPGQLTNALRATEATVHSWAAERSVGVHVLMESRRLAGVVRRARPHVVHLHSAKAGLAGRLTVRGRLPTVYQPHGWSYDANSGLMRRLTVAWERTALRWCNVVVCVSTGERASGLNERLRLSDCCAVVPNGVDLAAFHSLERAQARHFLGLDEGPLAVCVGRLSQQKGQGVLVEAWPLVREQLPHARLALVGDGPSRRELVAAAGAGICFVGVVPDPNPWYSAANVVVLPSRWGEGMALVPLEAMACRRSVIVTDVVGMREALPPESGAIVRPQDPVALAAAVVARLVDPALAEREGWINRRHVEAHHDADLTAARVAELYVSLLN